MTLEKRQHTLSQLLARFNSLGDKACAHPGFQSKLSA